MCTRVLFTNKKRNNLVGRNMDWAVNPTPQLWAMPKGVQRKAMAKTSTGEEFSWTSAYSSIVVSNFDCAISDGMNSEGLTANILWLSNSIYPEHPQKEGYYPMSMSIWAQYILDICKTVKDAVIAMNNIYIQTTIIPGSKKLGTCHLAVGDNDGNSAIFEYIDGHLNVFSNVKIDKKTYNHKYWKYTKDQVRVMANDPFFNIQIESLTYWNELNKKYASADTAALLPGSNLSLSRFVRATYFSKQMTAEVKNEFALAQLAAVMNNAAQPATKTEGEESEDLSRTQYISLADQRKLRYFFRSRYSPFMIWIDLKKVNFDQLKPTKKKKQRALKVELNDFGVYDANEDYGSGNVTNQLKPHVMLDFLEIPS
ncbi:linear amide C-N hydrolase [Kordia sp.]|uniref:linear amide C-N hydrolase n=1 Tax=Kordia sp. TaxID=1965332 RepID=UPI003B5B5D02